LWHLRDYHQDDGRWQDPQIPYGFRWWSSRGQILALDPVPPLDKIFNMVQWEENHEWM